MTGKEYVLSVLEQVEKRNSNEKEFLDAVKEVALSLVPVFDKHPEYIREGLLERIVEPERQIMFRVPWVDDAADLHNIFLKHINPLMILLSLELLLLS